MQAFRRNARLLMKVRRTVGAEDVARQRMNMKVRRTGAQKMLRQRK
jgi:hypothetical protein